MTVAVGELVSGYHAAAILKDCELRRVDDTLANRLAQFTAEVTWVDLYWSRQPVELVLYLGRAQWRWPARVSATVVQGQRVSGVAMGDPVVVKT